MKSDFFQRKSHFLTISIFFTKNYILFALSRSVPYETLHLLRDLKKTCLVPFLSYFVASLGFLTTLAVVWCSSELLMKMGRKYCPKRNNRDRDYFQVSVKLGDEAGLALKMFLFGAFISGFE